MLKISKIIDGLDMNSDEIEVYFNLKNQELVMSYNYELYEEDEETFNDVLIRLPNQYEIHEYSMMESFMETIDDNILYNQLLIAIHGSGAFRRFKDTCINFNVIDKWYKYRDKKYKEIAIKWCNDNEIEYEDDIND